MPIRRPAAALALAASLIAAGARAQRISDMPAATAAGTADQVPVLQDGANKRMPLPTLVGRTPFTVTGGTAARPAADKLGETPSTADFGVPISGDAQPTLQAGLNAVSPAAGGSGVLRVRAQQFSIISADPVIPADTRLLCEAGGRGVRATLDYRTVPCALMLNPARSVQFQARSAVFPRCRSPPLASSLRRSARRAAARSAPTAAVPRPGRWRATWPQQECSRR